MQPSQFVFFSSKGCVARASSISSVGSEPSPALSVLSLDALVAPDTPIQFDIISPVSEENSGQNKTTAQSGRCVCRGRVGNLVWRAVLVCMWNSWIVCRFFFCPQTEQSLRRVRRRHRRQSRYYHLFSKPGAGRSKSTRTRVHTHLPWVHSLYWAHIHPMSRLHPPPALYRSLPGMHGGEDGWICRRHIWDHEADPGSQGHPQHL